MNNALMGQQQRLYRMSAGQMPSCDLNEFPCMSAVLLQNSPQVIAEPQTKSFTISASSAELRHFFYSGYTQTKAPSCSCLTTQGAIVFKSAELLLDPISRPFS